MCFMNVIVTTPVGMCSGYFEDCHACCRFMEYLYLLYIFLLDFPPQKAQFQCRHETFNFRSIYY